MCGIAGFIGDGDIAVLHRMNRCAGTSWSGRRRHLGRPESMIFFGHRRLSILRYRCWNSTDDYFGRPISDHFQRRIYNHAELRKKLENLGHRFKTHHSDTEVLLYGIRNGTKPVGKAKRMCLSRFTIAQKASSFCRVTVSEKSRSFTIPMIRALLCLRTHCASPPSFSSRRCRIRKLCRILPPTGSSLRRDPVGTA